MIGSVIWDIEIELFGLVGSMNLWENLFLSIAICLFDGA